MSKPREFWMDTDLLDKALDNCDLGDGYTAKVRQYPHKDMLSQLTRVREVLPTEPRLKLPAELTQILEDYKKPDSQIDIGNLFYAATEIEAHFDTAITALMQVIEKQKTAFKKLRDAIEFGPLAGSPNFGSEITNAVIEADEALADADLKM